MKHAIFSFAGFTNPTTTPVPDVIFDRLLAVLKEAELKALLYIVRRTFGFKKDQDPISFNQFLRGITGRDGKARDAGCGVRNRTALSRALKSLETMGIIQADKRTDSEGDRATTVYRLRFKRNQARAADNRVVPRTYHPGSTPNVPPVVRQTYQQQTGLQQTDQEHHHPQTPSSKLQPTAAGHQPEVDDVVAALRERGITARVAHQLARDHPPKAIWEKLQLLDYLSERRSPLVSRNPAGWLRTAIEDDYPLPEEYRREQERRERRQWESSQQAEHQRDEVLQRASELRAPPRQRARAWLDAFEKGRMIVGRKALAVTERSRRLKSLVEQFTREREQFFRHHPELKAAPT